MVQIRNGVDAAGAGEARWATKSVASLAINATNLFAYTGTVRILAIIGRVTTQIQNQVTSVKLLVALTRWPLVCAAANIQAFAVGSLCPSPGRRRAGWSVQLP
jgi:hypothetical protein